MNNIDIKGDFPHTGSMRNGSASVGTTAGPLGYVYIGVNDGDGRGRSNVHMTPKRARELAKALKKAAKQAERALTPRTRPCGYIAGCVVTADGEHSKML